MSQDAPSYLERIALILIKEAKLPEPILEYKLCEDRKWKADFVWLTPHKILLEVEGGIWAQGRHVRPEGFTKDCEKYNTAALLGFIVLRVTKLHLTNGKMIEWVKRALER